MINHLHLNMFHKKFVAKKVEVKNVFNFILMHILSKSMGS
jgi:hypothetical protein